MRRSTLAAVAALIAVPALAQTSQLQQTQNQPGASVRTGGAAAGSMMPGDQRSGGLNAGPGVGPQRRCAVRTRGSSNGWALKAEPSRPTRCPKANRACM